MCATHIYYLQMYLSCGSANKAQTVQGQSVLLGIMVLLGNLFTQTKRRVLMMQDSQQQSQDVCACAKFPAGCVNMLQPLQSSSLSGEGHSALVLNSVNSRAGRCCQRQLIP